MQLDNRQFTDPVAALREDVRSYLAENHVTQKALASLAQTTEQTLSDFLGKRGKFIEGQSDPLLSDAWRAVWAALGNLAKAPTPAIQKARPNANGSTRDPVVYPQNNASQKPQNRSVPISELDKLVADAEKLTRLSSKIAQIYKL
jgi:hypothetical protein